MTVTISAARATAEVAECLASQQGHLEALARHGLTGVRSAAIPWWEDVNVVVLFARNEQGDHVGAVRLHPWRESPLPLQLTLQGIDSRMDAHVASFRESSAAELCGLWCASSVYGRGLGTVLTQMGLSVATQVGTASILSIVPKSRVAANEALGFRLTGDDFPYPRTSGELVQLLRIADAATFRDAQPENRRIIRAYQTDRHGSHSCTRLGSNIRPLHVRYDLALQGTEGSP